MARHDASPAPFGIRDLHSRIERYASWRTPAAALIMVILLGSALLGFLGGGPQTRKAFLSPFARLDVEYAPILRSGNWFETVILVTPKRGVEDLTIAIDAPLWEGMSIDTVVPDAESAEALDDRFTYHFGKVEAGEQFRLKLDGQIQPRAFRTLRGNITLLDGDRPLMVAPIAIRVLP